MTPSYTTTTRNALRALLGTSLGLDIDAGMAALAGDVDTKMLGYRQGTLEERGAAGKPGRLFRVTGTADFYLDSGSAWERIELSNALTVQSIAGPYSGFTTVNPYAEYTPSATRPAWVTLRREEANVGFAVYVGSSPVTWSILGQATASITVGFLVPAGQTWSFISSASGDAHTLIL